MRNGSLGPARIDPPTRRTARDGSHLANGLGLLGLDVHDLVLEVRYPLQQLHLGLLQPLQLVARVGLLHSKEGMIGVMEGMMEGWKDGRNDVMKEGRMEGMMEGRNDGRNDGRKE